MATLKRVEDDMISYCGSISAETFAARRRGNCTLRSHAGGPADSIAKRLREYDFEAEKAAQQEEIPKRSHFNSIFHYYRFLVIMFAGFSVGTIFLVRYNITIAILRMVNQTALYMEEHPDKTVDDFLAEGYALGGEFNWDNEVQHMVMSWYMIAYTLPQVPCTKLATMIGSRWSVPISLSICAISTLLTPMFAYWGWQWVIVLRLFNGLGAASVLPTMVNIVECWMPYEEFSLGLTFAQLLQATLSALNPLICGYLSSIHWKYAFYGPGTVVLVFCAMWLVLITDKPEENWFISKKELDHICGCTKVCNVEEEKAKAKDKNCSKELEPADTQEQQSEDPCYVPEKWYQIFFTSTFLIYLPIWCLYCGAYSCFWFILPTYLRQYLKIPVSQNGFYCSMIQCGSLLAVSWPHPFTSFLQNKLKMSLTTSRRITYFVVCAVCASTWIYVGNFHAFQLILLFLNRCAHGANDIMITATLMTNFSKAGIGGLAFSIVNSIGNLGIVLTSTGIGFVLDHTGSSDLGWNLILSWLGGTQLVMFLMYCTIKSEPIKFKKPKNADSNPANRDVEEAQTVYNKKDSILNNFEKLKQGNNNNTTEVTTRDNINKVNDHNT